MQGRKRTFSAALVILLVTTLSWSSATSDVTAAAFEAHPPISIGSNAEFTSANGVVGGIGTAQDPFIIQGWNITARGENAIDIRGTNAYFVIHNVYVSSFSDGIHIENAANGRIENSTVTQSLNGVYSFGTSAIMVLHNNLAYNRNGVNVQSSNTMSIRGNTILSSRGIGIFLLVIGNVNVTENNIFWSAERGISVDTPFPDPVRIFHNNLVRNGVQAYDDSSATWDDGYPSGGNYWSNYGGIDNCSGPGQDICSSPDGIGDDSHHFSFSGSDHYPLMKPFGIVPDKVPPIWVQASYLRASPGLSPSVVILGWTPAADEIGIVGYRIFQGTRLILTVPGGLLSEAVTDLPPNTAYTFRVEAGDVWDNWSENGPSVDVTTPPPPSTPGLYYTLLYTKPAYQGGTTVLMNWFNNTSSNRVRVTSVSVALDFGTYSWSVPTPCSICEGTETINLDPGEKKLLNLTAAIPSTASGGNHTVSATVKFQYFYWGGIAYWADGDPIVGQGSITIESAPQGPPDVRQPFPVSGLSDVLKRLLEVARGWASSSFLAILLGAYLPIVASACYLAVKHDRRRQRKMAE